MLKIILKLRLQIVFIELRLCSIINCKWTVPVSSRKIRLRYTYNLTFRRRTSTINGACASPYIKGKLELKIINSSLQIFLFFYYSLLFRSAVAACRSRHLPACRRLQPAAASSNYRFAYYYYFYLGYY